MEYFVGFKNQKRIIYSTINPKEMGVGPNGQQIFQKLISLDPNFQFTLKQAVNLSLSLV